MRAETKVGLLFIATLALIAAFAYYLDAFNPFTNTRDLWVAYNFAGGIEVVVVFQGVRTSLLFFQCEHGHAIHCRDVCIQMAQGGNQGPRIGHQSGLGGCQCRHEGLLANTYG